MAKQHENPAFSTIGPTVIRPEPPSELRRHGRSLWEGVLDEFNILDKGGLAVLEQACALADLAAELALAIEKDGIMVPSSTGSRSHPAIRDEISCRTAVARLLAQLGILSENIRPNIGRPPRAW